MYCFTITDGSGTQRSVSLEIEGLLVRVLSPAKLLCCVLEQDTLSTA